MSLAEMEWEEQRESLQLRKLRDPPGLFQSFWLGGFEGACQLNTDNRRIDMLAVTQHDVQAEQDYQLLKSVGIHACRDGVRWPQIEKRDGRFEFSSFLPMLRAANRQQMQVIWGLLHYGWPDSLDILSPRFPDRFSRFCRAVAKVVRSESDSVPYYVPVNEISFLSWAIGYKGCINPIKLGHAREVKEVLIRTAIAGMEAVWDVDPRARFCHVDPIIRVIAPADRPDLAEQAWRQQESQWESWDMIAGMQRPDLGGARKYLDIVGVNYYHSNQWVTPDIRLHWDDPPDPRRIPFHWMLRWVWERYCRPFFVAETSHFGVGRGRWVDDIAQELHAARLKNIPVQGACLYPIIDRPDWENLTHWHNSGLWDLQETAGKRFERALNLQYAHSLRRARALLASDGCK